jgi:hypothetical protein
LNGIEELLNALPHDEAILTFGRIDGIGKAVRRY